MATYHGCDSGGGYSKSERWVLHGKLYEVYYGTNVNRSKIIRMVAINPDGGYGDTLIPDNSLFNDIDAAIANTRALQGVPDPGPSSSPRKVTGAPQYVTHLLGRTGAWLRRYDPASHQIVQSVQLTCTDTLENATFLQVSDDNSVGVVITRGNNTRRWCAIVFDPRNYQIRAKLPIATEPERADSIAIAPDNSTAYVLTDFITNTQANSNVYPIDLVPATPTLGTAISVNQRRLQWMVISPDGGRLFLTGSFGLKTIWVMDTNTRESSVFSIEAPEAISPRWMLIHPFGHKLYIINEGLSDKSPMFVVDTSTLQLISATNPFTDEAEFPGISQIERPFPQFTPDGRYLFAVGGYKQITTIDTTDDSVRDRLPAADTTPGEGYLNLFFVPEP
jgi:hypothetical protein